MLPQPIVDAYAAVTSAQHALHHIIRQYFYVGQSIAWTKNDHIQQGVLLVISDFNNPQFKVRNTATGKEYWIFPSEAQPYPRD